MKRTSLVRVGLALTALLIGAPAASAQVAERLDDPRVYTDWEVTRAFTNGARTLIAGDFWTVGRHAPGAAIVSPLSGAPQRFIDVEDVDVVISDGADGWYVAANETVRHLRADGSVRPGFTVTAEEDVRGMALSPDGATLWLAARWDVLAVRTADGGRLPFPRSLSMEASDIALSPAGDIVYVSGLVRAPGETASRTVGALSAATGAVLGLGPRGYGAGLAVGPDAVYSGIAGDGGPDGVVALDPATLAVRWRTETSSEPQGLAYARGRVFIAGPYSAGGQVREGSLALDAATGAVTPWTAGLQLRGLQASPDGETLYSFFVLEDGSGTQVAVSARDGAELAWSVDKVGSGPIAISRDGTRMFASGFGFNTRFRDGVALLDETGHVVPWAEPEPHEGAFVHAALDAADTVYLSRGGSTRGSITAVTRDSEPLWTLQADRSVGVTLSADERTLFVTGGFSQLGGALRPGLAAVRAADGALLPWAPVASGGVVSGVVPAKDGRTLYLYGTFTAIDGVPRRGVAALDLTTGAVLPFDAKLDGPVALARLSPNDGVLYVAGQGFSTVGGVAHKHLAGVATADGRLVWRPAVDAPVSDFAPLPDGRTVLVAAQVDREPLDPWPLTAWDVRTGILLDWNPLTQPCYDACWVTGLTVGDGTVHVVGDFSANGGAHTYGRLSFDRVATAPVNTVAPRVVSTGAFNTYAECDPGHWSGHPDAYRFAWRVDGVLDPGFDGREFLLTQHDLGRTVSCEVSAGGPFVRSAPIVVTAGEVFTPAPRRRALPPDGPPPEPTPTPTAIPTATPTAAPTVPPAATATPVPLQSDTLDPTATPAPKNPLAASPLTDSVAPRAALRRGTAARPAQLTLSERARVTTTLKRGSKTIRRTFTLPAGRHALTARRLAGRGKLARGRYTLTVRVQDAAGNAAPARVLRFTV